ncbi:MAG: ATP-grasp domain-containing protein [Phycisphaerae bacterium]|nr:ATP-grasp domain-containing protein [Phycisphaerae bacterium]
MFIVDLPYASDYLNATLENNDFKVLDTAHARELLSSDLNYIRESDAIALIREDPGTKLYTSSENSIGWIENHLAFSKLPEQIRLFKDKVRFRALLKRLYPDFFYQAVPLSATESLDVSGIGFPFIIKPAVGFFSLGVHKVNDATEWPSVRSAIGQEIEQIKSLYPPEVLDTSTFIIEACIEGDEYAVDVYFNQAGKPVILNILKHIFSSDSDVSDRVYLTSKEIILENLGQFDSFLKTLGALTGIKNFPLHMEVRIDKNGQLNPIEINPMRFGGWCTTGDITGYAFGFNSYEYYFGDIEPNWEELLQGKEEFIYSLIVLNNSTGIPGGEIAAFDYDRLLRQFEKPLALRKTNHKEFPLFGFLFTQTRKENDKEIDFILKSNLHEFVL